MSGKEPKKNSPINGTDSIARENGALPEGTILKERYQLEKVLGRGGFGITYRALDQNVQVPVAVKEYLTGSGEDMARAMKEAQIAASLYDLEGIVAVRDYFVENGTAYIVMEYVHGISVKQYVARHGRMSGEEVLEGIRPLLQSIRKIHEKGILHRDISADNLMITSEGKLKLIDFGAASMLDPKREEHTVLIKRGFVPVEQYRAGEPLGPWTDIYSLCATIYFMITGMVPEDAMERWINDRIASLEEIYGTGLTTAQSKAIMKGLAVRKEERYTDVSELYRDLYEDENLPRAGKWFQTEELPHQILSGHTQTLRQEAAAFLKGKGRMKHVWIRSALAAVVILFLVAGLWLYLGKGNDHNVKNSGAMDGLPASTAVADAEKRSGMTPDATEKRQSLPSESGQTTDVEQSTEPAKPSPPKKKSGSPQTDSSKAGNKTDKAADKKAADKKAADKKAAVKTSKKPVVSRGPAKTAAPRKQNRQKQEFESDLDELLQ